MVKGSLQAELNQLFKSLNQSDMSEQVVSKAAFSKARKHLRYQAFIELNQTLTHTILQHSDKRWKGFRICAVDGSILNLPNHSLLRKHFDPNASGRPQARASQLYDVLNHITLDSSLNPMSTDERTLALAHLEHSQAQDLILYDRGYPAFYLFAAHQQKQRHFCMRSPWNLYNETRDFYLSDKEEEYVQLSPSRDAVKSCERLGLPTEPITVRLVRVMLPNGEPEILITSVETLPVEDFKALYHLRWGVEEDYKTMKSRLVVEQFSGYSVEAIYQDFYAKILSKNIASALAQAAQQQIDEETKHCRRRYQVNGTMVLSSLKEVLPRWLSGQDMGIDFLLKLIKKLSKNREAMRPDRQFARKKGKAKMYAMSYKTLP